MSRRMLPYFLLMFLSPLLGLYQAFQHRSSDVKRWGLIMFITFFGSIIYISEGYGDGSGHFQAVIEHYADLSFSQFMRELGEIMILQDNPNTNDDPYIHILSYLTGSALQLPWLFFVIAAFVYGYFYAGSLFLLFKRFPKVRSSKLFFFLATVFILWKSLEGVQYVRTFTGLWIIFYAYLGYYQTKRKKYLYLMFLPPFIHIGYAALCIPAWFVLLFGVRPKLYVSVFVLSFFSTLLSPSSVITRLQQTEVGEAKVRGYYTEVQNSADDAFQIYQSKSWYLQLYKAGVKDWAMIVVAAALISSGAYFRDMTRLESHLFSVGVLTYAFANSTSFLYAVSNRSYIVAGVFLLAPVLLMWQRGYFGGNIRRIRLQRRILSVSAILFVPFIVYQLANSLYWYSAYNIAAPFLPWINNELNMTLRQAIAGIFGV